MANCPKCDGYLQPYNDHCPVCGTRVKGEGNLVDPTDRIKLENYLNSVPWWGLAVTSLIGIGFFFGILGLTMCREKHARRRAYLLLFISPICFFIYMLSTIGTLAIKAR